MKKSPLKYIIPLSVGGIIAFIPLIGNFHVDSAFIVSLIGCFWAGWKACEHSSRYHSDLYKAFEIYLYLLFFGIPLLISDLFAGCFSYHGMFFWIIYPLPAVFFGYSIGRLMRVMNIQRCRFWTILVVTLVAVGPFIYELFTYPQVYFFNHVWGGWPGPIYDEAVTIQPSALYFRGLTILWIILIWNFPAARNSNFSAAVIFICVLILVAGYTKLNETGVVSSNSHLQDVLGGKMETDHFVIFYDKLGYKSEEVALLAAEHEFYLDRISRILNVDKPDTGQKIESYLYRHAWQKKSLTGAKFTSYVPVWLTQDQLHIAKQQITTLEHELVHIVAKSFGNMLFNASWSIGMIEGLAVAVTGGNSFHSTIDQIVVAEKPYPDAQDLKYTFSPAGFYGGRSGVNYTTSGSFVRYLLTSYPPENLKAAYRSANIMEAYDTDWETLTDRWHSALDSVSTDTVDRQIARAIFRIPSLFEQDCPRVQSEFAETWDQYRLSRAEKDTSGMLNALGESLMRAGESLSVKTEWAYQNLVAGRNEVVADTASLSDHSVELQLLYADAFALSGMLDRAEKYRDQAVMLLSTQTDSLFEPAIDVRSDLKQWQTYLNVRYKNQWLVPDEYEDVFYHTKIRLIQKAMEARSKKMLALYSGNLLQQPQELRYFGVYLDLAHHLAFHSLFEDAKAWIERLGAMHLRPRYRELLQKEQEWINYLEGLSAEPENM